MYNKIAFNYTPDPLNANFKTNQMVLDIDELYHTIDTKVHEFYETYKMRPEYIKIPEWVYICLMKADFTSILVRPVGNGLKKPFEPDRLFGYVVCHTSTIRELNEIELF